MPGIEDAINVAFSGGGDVFQIVILALVIGGAGLGLMVWGGYTYFTKKRWNLRVEIKLVRSDGKLTIGEWGKGYFDAGKGAVLIKRKGKGFKPASMKVFDIKKYLQGEDLLTVIQVGPDDYRPVLNDSWTTHNVEYENEETGETKVVKESILGIKIDTGMNRAWKSAWEASAKKAYSLTNFFSQFQTPIAIGIVIVCCFVGFAILWTKVGSACGA